MAGDLFDPSDQATVNIDVSSSAQYVQVTTEKGRAHIVVMNDGTATVWIRFGGATGQAATSAASIPIGPGTARGFTVGNLSSPIWVSAIAVGSTGKVYFTPGAGI